MTPRALTLCSLLATSTAALAQPATSDSARGAATFAVPEPSRALPLRTVAERAGLLPGVLHDPVGEALSFRGFEGATYVVDGLRSAETPDVPSAAVASVRGRTELVPARVGNALGVVVEVETRADVAALAGEAEGLTSDVFDEYGYRIAAASLGAGVVPGRLGLFAAAEVRRASDADPRAGGYVRVSDDALAALRDAPSAAYAVGPGGDVLFFPVPGDLPPGTPYEAFVAGLDVPEGYALAPSFVGQSQFLDPAAFEVGAADNPADALRLSGGLTAAPARGLALRLTGSYREDEGLAFNYADAVFNPEALSRVEADGWRLALDARQALGAGARLRLRASLGGRSRVAYDPRFTSDVRDALFYGDIEGPAAEVARRYRIRIADTILQLYDRDGDSRPSSGSGLYFPVPGAVTPRYEREEAARTLVGLDAGFDVGAHRLEAGVEGEWQTLRGFSLDPLPLARYYADGSVESTAPGLPPGGAQTYEELPFEAFNGPTVSRYGYDYLGLEEVDEQDVDAFFPDPADGRRANTDLAPRRPRYAAAYVQDALTLGPVALDLGLRVEHYGSNADVLLDPFAFVPIVRADGLPEGDVPDGIGDDFAVYFNSSTGVVVGFRNLDGQFFDADGQEASDEEITQSRSGQVQPTDKPISEAYRRAPTRTLALPRLGATLTIASGTEAHLFYNGLAQAAPAAFAFPALFAFDGPLNREAPTPSAALRPERADEVGIGLRQRLGANGRAGLTAFHRRYRDLAGAFYFNGGLSPVYTGYASAYDAIVYGATAAVEVSAGGLDALISATASREPLLLVERFALPYNVFNDGEATWRSALTAAAAYTVPLGRGPRVLAAHPLGGVRLGGALQARGGRPYRERDQGGPFYELTGEIRRAPAFVQLDLRAEKAVRLARRAELAAALWVENVLGRANVLDVYPATGQPDNNGGPSAGYFEQFTGELRAATEAQYDLLVRNPTFFGRPRQARLSLALRF